MDYQLNEDALRSLEIVRDQLGLIAGLLTHIRDEDAIQFVTAAQLLTFVDAQQGTVARVVEALLRECQQRACDRLMAARAAAEPVVPHIAIPPELLTGLMDASSGAVTDSETLLGLFDKLYDAGVEHHPYMDALHHFRDMLRGRGLVMHTVFQDTECSRSFITKRPRRESYAKSTIAKSRKRSQPATNA